jgi:hypothetical protein
VRGCLEFPLQVNFKNRLLGDAPNPNIIPMAGMAARFIQILFERFLPTATRCAVGILAFCRNA